MINEKRQFAGRLGGMAPHERRGFQALTDEQRKEMSARGVQARRRIREIDDLEIVPCTCNMKRGKMTNPSCIHCNGTGTVVVQKVKYYDQSEKEKL